MSALGDELGTKNREAVAGAKLIIVMDASVTTAAEPTYSVRLEAPEYSEEVLSDQTAAQVATALTEFTDWAAGLW